MDSILRAGIVYIFLLFVLRAAGKRTLSEATPFDLILLLIISEATQEAMVNDDTSMTNCAVLVLTLVGIDIGLSYLKRWIPVLDPLIEGTAVIVIKDGQILWNRLARERLDVQDIVECARKDQGLEDLSQVKMAVLERGGKISVVPW